MKFSGTVEYRLAADTLRVTAPRQVPYALATMLTKLSADVRVAVQVKMPAVFDQPTDFTLRGVWTQAATKASLESRVYIPASDDEAGKAQREYMRPGAAGASRR